MTIVLLLLAVLIGLALGMLGGGGAILTLPLLTLVAGMDTEEAVGGSLLVVGASALLGVLLRRGHGLIRWRAALLLGGEECSARSWDSSPGHWCPPPW